MKKLYKKVLNTMMRIPVRIERRKTFIAEWCAILRKKSLYKNVKWSKEQQCEFNSFWKKHYGKKISNRWHRLYEATNGIFNIKYIPEILYTTKIEPKTNDHYYCRVLSDKSLLGVLLDNCIPNVRTPKNFVANSFGVFYDSERHIISRKAAKELVYNLGEAVMKPTVDSSSGHNIRILNLQDGIDRSSKQSIEELFTAYGENFVIQEKIHPHAELKAIYPGAINTFRVISYTLNSKVDIAPISLRIGSGGGTVDNIHAGGMGINVNANGRLGAKAYKLGYGDKTDVFDSHPDTGVLFKDVQLSFVENIVAAAKTLHGVFSNIGVISWDFTVDEAGTVIIIEANLSGQGIWLPQIISGEGLFGENTTEYLKMIRRQ